MAAGLSQLPDITCPLRLYAILLVSALNIIIFSINEIIMLQNGTIVPLTDLEAG